MVTKIQRPGRQTSGVEGQPTVFVVQLMSSKYHTPGLFPAWPEGSLAPQPGFGARQGLVPGSWDRYVARVGRGVGC